MSKNIRIESVKEGYALGWSYVPLKGKKPFTKEWQSRDREDESQALNWAEKGNIGIRCGKNSGGLVVVDVDPGADVSSFDLPDTITVKTGRGGFHMYFKYDGEIKNSAGKMGKHIDVRADGGQVVAVGSIHPDTNKMYRYVPGLTPADVELADLPDWVLKRLQSKRKPSKKKPAKRKRLAGDPDTQAYARAALDAEVEAVEKAPKGQRNDTLNRAAFSIGTLIGAGALAERIASATLENAADVAGLIDEDGLAAVRATIKSGIESGKLQPRDIPNRPGGYSLPVFDDMEPAEEADKEPDNNKPSKRGASPGKAAACPPPKKTRKNKDTPRTEVIREQPAVMLPGTHLTRKGYKEVGNDRFAQAVLKAIPKGIIYDRGGLPVEITGPRGRQKLQLLTPDRMRLIMDQNLRLIQWSRKNKSIQQLYKNATRDHAKLALAAVTDCKEILRLNLFTNYPVYNQDWELAKPGYHEGTYYDEPSELSGIEPRYNSWAIMEDLLTDFPFTDEADKENFIGLLLTPLIRPAVLGNVPLFLIKSSLPRTGKTKLAEQVLGGIYLGEETPAMQWSTNEDERDKRILSVLKQGDTLLHVDNINHYMDSPALASLVTSKYYSGRLLGQSQMLRLENTLTIVATANNPRATGEIVKRTVPITLQPETETPELRDNFKHPHLFKYILNRRQRVWCWLLGMIENYKAAGFPATKVKMGGFEGWAAAMSGIMHTGNAVKWFSNWREWIAEADPEGEDLREFVNTWWSLKSETICYARELHEIAKDGDLFGMILSRSRSEQGQLTAFSQGVLVKYLNAPVDDFIIRRGPKRTYYLQCLRKG